MRKYNYICIEGNIGAGKTTLAKELASATGAELVLEEFEKNPFLPSFYDEKEKFALQTEMHFLHQRFRQLSDVFKQLQHKPNTVVADYWLAKSLVFSGINLSGANLTLFDQYARLLLEQVPLPDLVIYIHQHVDSLKLNISGRGRVMEQKIETNYLEEISRQYLAYIASQKHQKIVVVDMSAYSAGNHMVKIEHLLKILDRDWQPGVNEFSL